MIAEKHVYRIIKSHRSSQALGKNEKSFSGFPEMSNQCMDLISGNKLTLFREMNLPYLGK